MFRIGRFDQVIGHIDRRIGVVKEQATKKQEAKKKLEVEIDAAKQQSKRTTIAFPSQQLSTPTAMDVDEPSSPSSSLAYTPSYSQQSTSRRGN